MLDLSCVLDWRHELKHVNGGKENDEERFVLVLCNLIGDRSLLFVYCLYT